MKVKCSRCGNEFDVSFKEYLTAPLPRLCYKCLFNVNEGELKTRKHETVVAIVRLPHVVDKRPLEQKIIAYAEGHGYRLENMSSVPLPRNIYSETHYIFRKSTGEKS